MNSQKMEAVIIQMMLKTGETIDRQSMFAVRNGIRDVLAAKERHHRRMSAPAYQWKKPVAPRR